MFEFRFYDVASGRRADEVARMYDVAIAGEPNTPGAPPDHSISMFDRYGIPRPLGAWTGISGPRQPSFGYIMQWESLAKRDVSFPPFWADPHWKSIRDRTDNGSAMVEKTEDWLMTPSPAWKAMRLRVLNAPVHPHGLHEMLIQKVENGYLDDATDSLSDVFFPALADRGATLIGAFNVVIGPDMPAVVSFLSWPDFDTQQIAWEALHTDPLLLASLRKERETFGSRLIKSTEHHLLQPVSFGVPDANFGVGL